MQPNRIGHAFAKPPVTFSEIRNQLFEAMDHIISVAGIFDLTSGRSNIIGSHVDEIIDKLDGFFGIRLKQIDRGLAMPRQQLPEDPLGDVFRALLGTRSIEVAKSMLLSAEDQHIQQALYSFRTLSVQDLRPYLVVLEKFIFMPVT